MAVTRLDNTGTIKMKTLDEALLLLQRINGLVEQYALAVRTAQGSRNFASTIRRTLPTLADNLKAHFGMIAELVMSVNIATSRGASEAVRVRQLREGVAHIKQAIEVAMASTKDRHAIRAPVEPDEEAQGDKADSLD
jgi:hypothetical protein